MQARRPGGRDADQAARMRAGVMSLVIGSGLLGIKYPTEFGGMGLDFSYSMVMAEALGTCDCGGVPMSIGVQTDMATPALARSRW